MIFYALFIVISLFLYVGSIHGVPTTFWSVFFSIFFRSIWRYGPKNTFGEKKLGPSYQKFRDRCHFLGTCLILCKLCKKSRGKTKIFPKTILEVIFHAEKDENIREKKKGLLY